MCNDFLNFPCLLRPPAATEGLMQCLSLFLSALFVQLWSSPISCGKNSLTDCNSLITVAKHALGMSVVSVVSTLISWNRKDLYHYASLQSTKKNLQHLRSSASVHSSHAFRLFPGPVKGDQADRCHAIHAGCSSYRMWITLALAFFIGAEKRTCWLLP